MITSSCSWRYGTMLWFFILKRRIGKLVRRFTKRLLILLKYQQYNCVVFLYRIETQKDNIIRNMCFFTYSVYRTDLNAMRNRILYPRFRAIYQESNKYTISYKYFIFSILQIWRISPYFLEAEYILLWWWIRLSSCFSLYRI